jgi:hypothetical protein
MALAVGVVLSACASSGAQTPPDVRPIPLTASEIAYVEQTAAVVYRRASVDRLAGLLFSGERGHGVCVRSPAGAGDAADYSLLVLQRRIVEDFISQADDDVLILRSAAEAAPCRRLGSDPRLWVRAR